MALPGTQAGEEQGMLPDLIRIEGSRTPAVARKDWGLRGVETGGYDGECSDAVRLVLSADCYSPRRCLRS